MVGNRTRLWVRAVWQGALSVSGLLVGFVSAFILGRTASFSEELFKWIANNGFAVVVAIFTLYLLRMVVLEAIAHFNAKLDSMSGTQADAISKASEQQSTALRDATGVIRHLDSTIERSNEVLVTMSSNQAKMSESQQILIQFVSQNMAQLAAHRETVESAVTGEEHPAVTGVIKPVSKESGK